MRRSSSTHRASVAAVVATLAAALMWHAWQSVWAHGDDTPVSWVDLTSRTFPEPARASFRSFRAHEPLRRELLGEGGLNPRLPAIDFSRRTAILVSSGPRSSSAYDLEIVRIDEERRRIVVRVRERAPSLDSPGAAALTFPFRLITIERSDKPVTLDLERRS